MNLSRDPIRAELFSLERLEQHAESLAAAQHTAPKRSKAKKLLPRVRDNHLYLKQGYRVIAQAIGQERAITPAAEWLVDNFPVVEEQIREIIDDLPPGFYRELPKLAEGHLQGYPRILGVAWAFIAHTDSRFDPDWLRRYVQAYQKIKPLYIGEIWALAISLRIVLVENLRRMTETMVASKVARQRADALADGLLGLKGKSPADPSSALRPFERGPLPRAFAVQLVMRLRDQEGRVSASLEWLDKRLADQQTTSEEIVRLEHQEQTAMNTTVRNVITSMRLLTSMDWAQYFEDVSAVDEILRAGSGFAAMDFATRDLYRHAIEQLARGSGHAEVEVARRVISATRHAPDIRRQDPGYYLISAGRFQFEKELGLKIRLRQRFLRFYISWATPAYLGSLVLVTGLVLTMPLYESYLARMSPLALAAFAVFALIPASDLAVALVNRFVTDSLGPQVLPKMDFPAGVPEEYKTLVVMPTLLTSPATLQENLERLEIHYLGNPEGHLQFALLMDWADAPQEHMPDDDTLADAAREGIRRLNEKYPRHDVRTRFFVFLRRRLWNPSEGVWMGWERKRGKLHELNRWLRGDAKTSFMNPGAPPEDIKYVITLDSDTRLFRGAAYRLVGAMAHPLNRPRFDPEAGRVVEGYGILQPRITATLPTAGFGSLYQQIYSGSAGIDPYAFAVSDVYQDLFKEGSYVGKGIYDIDAFEASLAGRVPENTLLSHDLFEGLYARTALVTDIELFEEFPSHYEVAIARSHRWIRGDWQLLPFIFRARLPLISRWKMIDNLRRSLSAPSAYLALLCAWTVREAPSGMWMGSILTTIAVPPLLPVLIDFLPRRRQVSMISHLRGMWTDFRLACWQMSLALVFLAHQAWVMTDAIARSLYRLTVSRRHLLEWTSTALSKDFYDYKTTAFYRRMMSVPLLAFSTALLTSTFGSAAQSLASFPFVFLWLICPWIAQRISLRARVEKLRQLSAEDRRLFRLVARKTWRFFETFVTSEHHHLPPDNFQEIPRPVVAHRTSPTNIGLYLLSIVAARRFGWLGVSEMVERLEDTLGTVQTLPRYQGHLFNWYDTEDLRALEPRYVSTVDSGNLAGHLWALANACLEVASGPPRHDEIFSGIQDVLTLMTEAASSLFDSRRTETVTVRQLHDAIGDLEQGLQIERSIATSWRDVFSALETKAEILVDIARTLGDSRPESMKSEVLIWSERLMHQIQSHARDFESGDELSPTLVRRLNGLARSCRQLVSDMQFGFLCDPVKKIFSIGYQMADMKMDPGYYDLLASEARLASFVAIAKGDVPVLHWFHLSRSLSPVGYDAALLSWSGSMFEYLMPSLVMHPPAGSLLDQTCRSVVRRQIAYGKERGIPWGVSESGYNAQDLEFTYQYSNFGVPGLGLKRGLSQDLITAPYATALAAMVDPSAAADNFRTLTAAGGEGRYGYYEALDYTPTRLPEDQKVAVVQQYMSHHQGMSLVALANVLYRGTLCHYFHAEPMVQATELLLQERTPRDVPLARVRIEETQGEVRSLVPIVLRRFNSPHDVLPRTHLLSNGRYSVMITAAGSGYSRWKDLAVTRWREDTTRDPWGTYIFLRDARSGDVWSAGYQPTGIEPDSYEVDFSEDRAEIVRRDGTIVTTMEVVVSPEDDAEIRRVTLKNVGESTRDIEVTSYAEIVLATPAADLAHPAFSNLFVQTEFVTEVTGLICHRRPRSPEDPSLWAGHVVVVDGTSDGELQYESSRALFLGRGRTIRSPQCVIDGKPLSNTAGAVLDPVVSLRRRVHLEPGETVRIIFTTMMASSREEVLVLADKYHDLAMFERTVTLAWTQAHIQQHYLGIQPSEAHLFQDMASRILYSEAGLRPSPAVLERNHRGAPGLWAYGISGDLPIVLVRIDEEDDREIVREVLRAHEYWRLKNLAVDLVILNEKGASYASELQNMLESLVRANQATLRQEVHVTDGDIFVLRAERLSIDDRVLLMTAARIIVLSRHGTLSQQMARLEGSSTIAESLPVLRRSKTIPLSETSTERSRLQFFNGIGGFSPDGREYVTILGPGQWTPAPWINVISNPLFGFQVSESGSGYTWAGNSRENQLTPWSNDPVTDPTGETFYISDEESGDLWSPTALPIREENSSYTARHGLGYSRFEHVSHGIRSELLQCVSLEDPVKISRLRLVNTSKRTRRLSITAYVEWVLGPSRQASGPFIITEKDERTGVMLARNPWNTEFENGVAFLDMVGAKTWTSDRSEFLGRNGSLDHPSALESRRPLSGRVGSGLDPCAALQAFIELRPGDQKDVLVLLGEAAGRQAALDLVTRYRKADVDAVLMGIHQQWETNLGSVQVRTPDRAMDFMLNGWLLYQTLACRIWARAAFYQAGGAYGFRDQLQDVMALLVPRRDLAREHILRAAARQFPEGDVQHWWHPPTGRGVRTRISDDLLWLPYVVNQYMEVTGDTGILEESVPFLEGQAVPEGKDDAYFQPGKSAENATVFEHCARAIDHSLSVGVHGLPLMGTGDWNDGMNRVGHEGKGESVWLAWILHATLFEFAKRAETRGESARAEKWRLHVSELKVALERHGWDGDWYRRAYFDDGTPLGSVLNKECQIDSIAQSWAVLSGAADPARAERAMAALDQRLIQKSERLSLLFSPPFDHTVPNPGYIQGYLSGVRENGGQYTHAAVWALLAFAALGDGDKAGELFAMLNPIHHGSTRADIQRYKVEPYVMAGDVYAVPPHTGRGGWTWYTGAAGWMYRAGVEWILGFRLRGTTLFMDPCIPRDWPEFELSFRYHSSRYEIKVLNPNHVCKGISSVEVDGKPVRGSAAILLKDDGATHDIRIVLGKS